jgi:hypothetical protein
MSQKWTLNISIKHDASIFGVKMIMIKIHPGNAGRMIRNVVTLSWGGVRDDCSTDSTCFLLVVCLDNSSTPEMDIVHSSEIALKFYLFLTITVSHEYNQKPDKKIFPTVKRVMSKTSVTM